MVSLYVGLHGNAQNLLRAKADAHLAFLAAFWDDKYLPAWHCFSIQVQGGAGKHLHGLIPRVRLSSNSWFIKPLRPRPEGYCSLFIVIESPYGIGSIVRKSACNFIIAEVFEKSN
jgi:hypothetical protein